MGLVFALQSDVRKSNPDTLVLRSSKKKFGLGGAFIFGAALIGTLYLASAPIFRLFWREGAWFDKGLTIFIHAIIYGYPALALICWFYEQVVVVRKEPDGRLDVDAYKVVFGIKWQRYRKSGLKPDDFEIRNWLGSKNVAGVLSHQKQVADRYANKGHWMLLAGGRVIERRARREDIDLLRAQLDSYFLAQAAK